MNCLGEVGCELKKELDGRKKPLKVEYQVIVFGSRILVSGRSQLKRLNCLSRLGWRGNEWTWKDTRSWNGVVLEDRRF